MAGLLSSPPSSLLSGLFAVARHGVRRVADACLPNPCMLCGLRAGARHVCMACMGDLPGHGSHRCLQCGLRLGASRTRCQRCEEDPPAFDATIAALDYCAPVDRALIGLKFGGRLAHARAFGGILAALLDARDLPFDQLSYVPLSAQRLRERGFNQSLELARTIGKTVGRAPGTLLIKVKDTGRQADLSLADRRINMRHAFACTADVRGRRIALVDDVMTTGSTLDEAARCLKAAGAAAVINLVVARTP